MSLENLNENIRLYLIKTRKNAGLSQADVAAKSEIWGAGGLLDQNAVVRLEKQPLAMDFIKLSAYLRVLGISVEEFYGLLHRYAYETENDVKIRIREGLGEKPALAMFKKFNVIEQLIQTLPAYTHAAFEAENFKNFEIHLTKSKPTMGFFGGSNSGKSSFINLLIGHSLLPTSISVTTRVITVLMHLTEKPAHITNDVAVFKKGFHPLMIFNESMMQSYLVAQGDKSLLSSVVQNEAYIAVVFVEAELLKHVWLIDTAGDLNNERDTGMAFYSASFTDGVVFMSDEQDFLKPNEWGLMTNLLRLKPPKHSSLNPVDHFLLLASQCRYDADMEVVTEKAKQRLNVAQAQLGNLVFSSWRSDSDTPSLWQEFIFGHLLKRIQPFGLENANLRKDTLLKIEALAKYLIPIKEKELVSFGQEIAKGRLKNTLTDTLELLESLQSHQDSKDLHMKVKQATDICKNKFYALIDTFEDRKKADVKALKTYFDNVTSQTELTQILEELYPNDEDQKTAQSEIGNYICQLLIMEIVKTFTKQGQQISKEVHALLSEWHHLTPKIPLPAYDIFQNSLDDLPNVGAFEAQYQEEDINDGIKQLSEPLTNAIILANTIGFITYRYVGGSWHSNLAKKIANVIRTEDIWENLKPLIINFWDDTEHAMTTGLAAIITASESMRFDESNNLRCDDISNVKKALGLLEEIAKGEF